MPPLTWLSSNGKLVVYNYLLHWHAQENVTKELMFSTFHDHSVAIENSSVHCYVVSCSALSFRNKLCVHDSISKVKMGRFIFILRFPLNEMQPIVAEIFRARFVTLQNIYYESHCNNKAKGADYGQTRILCIYHLSILA